MSKTEIERVSESISEILSVFEGQEQVLFRAISILQDFLKFHSPKSMLPQYWFKQLVSLIPMHQKTKSESIESYHCFYRSNRPVLKGDSYANHIVYHRALYDSHFM